MPPQALAHKLKLLFDLGLHVLMVCYGFVVKQHLVGGLDGQKT
jgi:hypothetical protein